MSDDDREQVQRDVWVPVKHPVTGKRVNVRAMASEQILTEQEAAELEQMIGDLPDPDQGQHDDR